MTENLANRNKRAGRDAQRLGVLGLGLGPGPGGAARLAGFAGLALRVGLALTGLLWLLAGQLEAQAGPAASTWQVRPGTVIQGCGGFAFRCEAWLLSGSLSFTTDPSAITASRLELSPLAGSGVSPFPASGDLQLEALVGSSTGGRLRFESPAGAFQTVALELTPFGDLDGASDGYFLSGRYDEGCCDRFVFDFGVVPLLPVAADGALVLRDGRFTVRARFRDFEGRQAAAVPIPLDGGSGWFWFFEPQNPELFVKVLDACEPFGRYWVFVAGLTNLGVDVEVFDRDSDFVLVYDNPVGQSFETVVDTEGYPCAKTLDVP